MSSQLPVVRSTRLNGDVLLAQSLGMDAHAMLRQVVVNAQVFADLKIPRSTETVSHLLEASAEAINLDEVGLQLAARQSFFNLGSISLVLKEEPTTTAALGTLSRYLK